MHIKIINTNQAEDFKNLLWNYQNLFNHNKIIFLNHNKPTSPPLQPHLPNIKEL